MRRKGKVKGLTLDLTKIPESGVFILEDLIVTEPVKDTIVREKSCSVCNSIIIGALKECNGTFMCGLCRAIHDKKVSEDVIIRLKEEYAKPCEFCGKTIVKKHFDHINMFSKIGCVGIMVENAESSDIILHEIDKCQILCINCHNRVTNYEQKHGFIREKKILNARIAAGEDMTAMRAELFTKYSDIMTGFYAAMRKGGGQVLPDYDDK